MKKILLLISAVLLITFNGFNKDINLSDAEKVALNFYFLKCEQNTIKANYNELLILDQIVYGDINKPDFYAITFEPGGFVIVSGVDELYPIIGYSIQNEFNKDNQPEHYKSFLQSYSDKIAYIREKGVSSTPEIEQAWDYLSENFEYIDLLPLKDALEPLVPCKWNQSYPYNILCPEDNNGPGGHVYAGCVATAMAQVMYYWRYPLQGTGSHSYYWGSYGYIYANFGATQYEWDAMENSINHNNPYPIAELQFHCGVAVEMMYSPNGSGAYSSDVPPALENYFGYSQDASFLWKDNYSNSEWINMLKDNLDDGMPMYYSGYSTAGGHAFVCDGYQDDLFHFNFGWGGSADGYYSLANVNGFHDGQGSVFDIYPDSNYPYYCSGDKTFTEKRGTFEDGSGPVADYQNLSECTWLISPQTPEDSITSITLLFSRFDVAINDNLIIYDGSTTDDDILATLSGSEIPEAITSTGNQMLIRFITDDSGTSNGWLASFYSIIPDFCKGITDLTEQSADFSDNSGNFNYHNSSVCMWKILPENAESVTVEFTEFDTEPGMDVVMIFDFESQELLAEYSGHYSVNDLPEPVTSYSGKMFVVFSSNKEINFGGWQANYNTVPVGVKDVQEEIHSLKVYPNPANDLLNISFIPKSETNVRIQLQNIDGKIVYSHNLYNIKNKLQHIIDISEVASGMYIFIIKSDKALIREKIIKK